MKYTCVIQFKLYLPRYARFQIPTYKLFCSEYEDEEEEKITKHTIERKMQISKVDETYCVLRYNIWQIEHTSKDNS
jgi:hypothetical protein